MTLYLIGIGLGDEKDITLRGLEAVKGSSKVYLEGYTSLLQCSVADMEKLYGQKVEVADRAKIEQDGDAIVAEAKDNDVSVLIIGDVFGATTHLDLQTRAREAGVSVQVVHNASVLTAVGDTGLQLYKFGRVASIPFPQEDWTIEAFYNVLKDNMAHGLHTLFLLDLDPPNDKYMTVGEAIEQLVEIEKLRGEELIDFDTKMVGCARLGTANAKIVFGNSTELQSEDFGGAPHCLIIPGRMHFMEEEALEVFRPSL